MSDITTNKHKRIRLAIIVATAIFSIAAISIYFIVTEPTRQKEKCLEEYRQFVSAIEATNTEYDYHTWETNMAKKDSFHLRLKEYELEPEERSEIVKLDKKLIDIRTSLWEKAADKFTSSLSRGSSVVGRMIDTNIAKVYYLEKNSLSVNVYDIKNNTTNTIDLANQRDYLIGEIYDWRKYKERLFAIGSSCSYSDDFGGATDIYYIDMCDNSLHHVINCYKAAFSIDNAITITRLVNINYMGDFTLNGWESYDYTLSMSLSDAEYSTIKNELDTKDEKKAQDSQTQQYGYSSNSSHNSYGGSSSSNSRLMTKFNKLNEEGRRLTDEIGQYYYSGQAGPWVITDVYRLKQIQDEKIGLAQEMGDRQLEALCRQQKAQTLIALRQMGF